MVAPNGPLLSVAEARAARERARSGAQDKGKEVHRWLDELVLPLSLIHI